MKTPSVFTSAHEKCLRNQLITEDQPGSVLHDFQVILDALQPDGLPAGGKHNLLPIAVIPDLDRRLRHPLNLQLKRPQIKSHPYLQGLNLLLRATGLSRVVGVGDKAHLVLDPVMMDQWDQFNATERYFNLMEAAFRIASVDMIGERGGWGNLLSKSLTIWTNVPKGGRKFKLDNPHEIYGHGLFGNLFVLALLDLFGLVAVEHAPRPPAPWLPAGIAHVPFGDALLTLLAEQPYDQLFGEDEEAEGDEDEPGPKMPRFGAWQPLFQSYFPEWRQNLEFPRIEPREGMFVFKVSLGKSVWRLIAIPSSETLEDLASMILHSVDFDNDHLYEFTYRDRTGASRSVNHPNLDEGPWASDVLIGSLPLEPGQMMGFRFDFGDNWKFDVKLERIEPFGRKKTARILERHGKAPKQYGDWDD